MVKAFSLDIYAQINIAVLFNDNSVLCNIIIVGDALCFGALAVGDTVVYIERYRFTYNFGVRKMVNEGKVAGKLACFI